MNSDMEKKPTERVNGIKMMGHGGVTSRGCKQLKCGMKPGVTHWSDWNEGWTADWTEQQGQWQRIGPGLVKRPQWNCKLVSDPKKVQFTHWFLSPLEISSGRVLEPEMDELGSSNSHSSWGDSVCVVSGNGLACLERRLFCQCDNCEFKSWQFCRALDRDQQKRHKMTLFFESLPPLLKILLAEFSMIQNFFSLKQMWFSCC